LQKLRLTSDGVTIAALATSFPAVPTSWATVPQDWTNDSQGPYGLTQGAGAVPQLDLELWAAGSTNVTAASLVAAMAHPLASFSEITVTPELAAAASINLGSHTTDADGVLAAALAGAAGDGITFAMAHGSGAPSAGALTNVGLAYTFTFLSGVTTEANLEEAVAASGVIVVQTPGTPTNVLLVTVDEFSAVALSGGIDTQLNATGHGLVTGDGPVTIASTGVVPLGLVAGASYWVIKVDANNFKLAATARAAMSGQPVNFTSVGSGTITVNWSSSTCRMSWMQVDNQLGLGEATPGTIPLTATAGFVCRVNHRPRAIAYGLVATLSSAVATSATLYPIEDA
jgi:hypothetical protein